MFFLHNQSENIDISHDVFNAVLFAANTEDYEPHGCCQAIFILTEEFFPFAFRNALI